MVAAAGWPPPARHATMPIDVHAEIDPQDRINEIADAWRRMDGVAALRTIVMQAREAKEEAAYRVIEVKDLRKKRFWGSPGERRWQLQMKQVPTTQANGTCARYGAPLRMENMNIYRHGLYGGGPPLDVGEVTRLRHPLRRVPTPAADPPRYDWYARGHATPFDSARALRGVPCHVASSNFSSNTSARFEATKAAGPDFDTRKPGASRSSQRFSTTGRFRDFACLDPPLVLDTPKVDVVDPRAQLKARAHAASIGKTSRADLDKVAQDVLFHPIGTTVTGPDPAALCDRTLGAYRATLGSLRAQAPR